MNLNNYNSNEEKELRQKLESLAKDAEALKRAESKMASEEVVANIKQKLSQIRKQMEMLCAEYYLKNKEDRFYPIFTQESASERKTYRYFCLSKAIKSGRRKASRGNFQQHSCESEM